MLKFEQFLIYKSKHKSSVNSRTLIIFIIHLLIIKSYVNSASLTLKTGNLKCADPGLPAYAKLLNNLVYPSTISFLSRSSPPNLITSQNDFIVTNNSEISIDILNFNNNNGPEQNQVVYEQGEIVSYNCFVGHLMIGSAHRKCLPNGQWSGQLPICDTLLDQFDLMKSVESTNQLYSDNIKNNSRNQDNFSAALTAQSVNFLKFAPPELAIDHRFSTCFHSEKYGPRVLRLNLNKSMRILGIAITIPRENLDYDFSVYIGSSKQNMDKGRLCLTFRGSFATKTTILLCQTTISGDRINIEDNTKQIQTFSICEIQIYIEKDEIECGEPEVPLNGFIVSKRGGQVEYQCKLGYYLTGSPVRQCQKNGLYSGEQAVCNEIQCKEDSSSSSSSMNDQQLSLQISAQLNQLLLTCEQGYQFTGIRNHSIVCLGDGRFDTRITPSCELIDCGSPLYISEQANGEFVPLVANKTTYGSMAKLRCFDSNSVYSSEQILISCESTGQWSTPKAVCISDFLKANGQARQLKNRLGTLIVSVLLILVLLILLLTIFLFKKRILLLAMHVNEKKLNEANIRRNVNLISSNNNNVVSNSDLINQVSPELCLDVDSSSNSENNSSLQPSSKISIQNLFGRKKRLNSNTNSQESGFFKFRNLKSKLTTLKNTMGSNKIANYISCFNQKEENKPSDQFQIQNQFLHGQLNPIFIDQLDCQDTSIKECAFKQYNSSTLKPNQINLVRLANQQRQQRVARLLKASNYHFNQFNQLNQLNQFDQINQFNRNQLISSSMKSDSLLVSTRRQHVRDQLIDKIKRKPKGTTRKQNSNTISGVTPSSQLLIKNSLKEDETLEENVDESSGVSKPEIEESNNKQFYYFAQHCYTLPQKNKVMTTTNRNQIDLMQPDTFDIKPSEVVDILNYDNSSSAGNSSSSSSSNGNSDSTFKDSTEGTVKSNRNRNANLTTSTATVHNDLDKKTNKTMTTADIHLKNIPKNLKYSTSQTGNGQNGLGLNSNDLKNLKKFQYFKKNKQSASINRLNSSTDANSNTKYIVIDDTVFGD